MSVETLTTSEIHIYGKDLSYQETSTTNLVDSAVHQKTTSHYYKWLLDADSTADLTATTQKALLLHAPFQEYLLEQQHIVPITKTKDEILVKVIAVGLNPIDWKGPAYNFGIPSLPWVNGRDLVGVITRVSETHPRLRVGDIILAPSTDYRDIRKAAFQEFAVTTTYNAARVPKSVPIHDAASIGVAFVASALGLGLSLGLDFSQLPSSIRGPNLLNLLETVDPEEIPSDIREQCLASIKEPARPATGDWLVIWGASTTTGLATLQLAKLYGLRVIGIADLARHGRRLKQLGADIVIDRHDQDEAVRSIVSTTDGKLRFGVDIVGKETAELLQQALSKDSSNLPSHLLGLTGLPKSRDSNVRYHSVPIKLFHEVASIGNELVLWLEKLLSSGALKLPETISAPGGLSGINDALDQLRSGHASGKRIVVTLDS
ncbi:oxidoreductase [Xylona heveae TC161]|uniref:Oxidoreductase n=1 Tax=Xylona heveae (strain CBS 132557 / TC161) TaxID=1328760 RepID=A0A164ZC81_XYLHT|nr:oxidoreductase [Xylona heveae TC161]KZF18923.1 oxidoreductase [Xylona heveae TC161]